MFRVVLFIFFIFLLSSSAYSNTYYADIIIDVNSQGQVTITGDTNSLELSGVFLSEKFTSKQNEYWLLNITTREVFGDFIYELNLPTGSQINYIKTTPTFRIENQENKIRLIGTGEDKPLTLIVQYSISSNFLLEKESISYLWLTSAMFFVIILCLLGIIWTLRKSRRVGEKKEDFDIEILPKRQRDIIEILKKKKRITQKELEEILNIPKSSISRNLKTLEVRGIVKKRRIGQTNYLFLE